MPKRLHERAEQLAARMKPINDWFDRQWWYQLAITVLVGLGSWKFLELIAALTTRG